VMVGDCTIRGAKAALDDVVGIPILRKTNARIKTKCFKSVRALF
jgi:hypothetical protein